MKLINLTNATEVAPGDMLESSRGEKFQVANPVGQPPQHAASTGRIYVFEYPNTHKSWQRSYFPSVCECKWIADDEPIPEPYPSYTEKHPINGTPK